MLPLLLCSILGGTASTGGLEAFRVLIPPPQGLWRCPPGGGGRSAACSACRARRGCGAGVNLVVTPSLLSLTRRALTRCEIVANSTEYFKSSNAVMAARGGAARQAGSWAGPPASPLFHRQPISTVQGNLKNSKDTEICSIFCSLWKMTRFASQMLRSRRL